MTTSDARGPLGLKPWAAPKKYVVVCRGGRGVVPHVAAGTAYWFSSQDAYERWFATTGLTVMTHGLRAVEGLRQQSRMAGALAASGVSRIALDPEPDEPGAPVPDVIELLERSIPATP